MRVLFLSHRLPYAPNRGDRLRAHALLRALRPFATVDLLSLAHDAEEASHAEDLLPLVDSVSVVRTSRIRGAARAVAALLTGRPLTHALLHAPGIHDHVRRIVATHRPDVVLAFCSGMAPLALEAPLAEVPLLLDMVDLDSRKWAALASATRAPLGWIYAREARLMTAFERQVAQRAAHVLVVNPREREAMLDIEPTAHVSVLANGVALGHFAPTGPPPQSQTVTFCGVMNYRPNVDGALWLARDVWPLVRARVPAATLSLVGMHPTAAIRALAGTGQQIVVTGAVPDVRPYLWQSALAVAPLQVARGIQNKVLEALAAGLPCIVTPVVADGLPGAALPGCTIAPDASAFASAIVDGLQRAPDARRAEAARADLSQLDWPHTLSALQPLLSRIATGHRD